MDAFVESLKKDFNVNADLSDIQFTNFSIQPYNANENSDFGEEYSVLQSADFIIYNLKFRVKVLSFTYPDHCEILKLEIFLLSTQIEKEIAYCRNFLQRKRNLNLVFEVLSRFAKYVESRRIICVKILGKRSTISLIYNEDEGYEIKCESGRFLFFKCNWRIHWQVDNYEVVDVIEFYFDKTNQLIVSLLKPIMWQLVRPQVDFQKKLKLWDSLMRNIDFMISESPISNSSNQLQILDTAEVLEIDDSEEEPIVTTSALQNGENWTDNDDIIIVDRLEGASSIPSIEISDEMRDNNTQIVID